MYTPKRQRKKKEDTEDSRNTETLGQRHQTAKKKRTKRSETELQKRSIHSVNTGPSSMLGTKNSHWGRRGRCLSKTDRFPALLELSD